MSGGFTIEGVSKTFDGSSSPVRALDDIRLTVEEGEFVVLLGRSGCGKSTLLEIMAGLQNPTSGTVHLGQELITEPNEKIGMVFQDPSLYPWRTVARNVELGLELAGVPKARRKTVAQEHLELVGLPDAGPKYPRQLSGGMRQRVGIARALATEPDVLLMDEPFGAVDHLTRLQLQRDLLRLWSEHKRTVVFVTHDVAEAIVLADRIVLLTPGPGRIARTWTVDGERPRELDSPELMALRDEIYSHIGGEPAEESVQSTVDSQVGL
ncbi:nitrate ABC transporter ATP-binding protein [Prauserella marina]|uniref:NitT/TauT family transport system ATP-binding protein n=1 Tax=Prauserella marina TaxID=530584 RepID=A0A222VQZ7_9PSEU|nr:ABC transporter ATP-binding protein [Prauserella marina]ASR36320.1 nitrate ABC transporter ATP-binding protein [Prauserella marina]PWV77103.1 NitT/TauT family transport system ATP-binding protein [Prauserella marina]SDD04504.1 NitT/TauT family transport system ATP-binding protein [Prauserella marina]